MKKPRLRKPRPMKLAPNMSASVSDFVQLAQIGGADTRLLLYSDEARRLAAWLLKFAEWAESKEKS